MRCDRFREAASARLDGEPIGMSSSALDHHLATCANCAAWAAEATRLTRLARLGAGRAARSRRPDPGGDRAAGRAGAAPADLAAARAGGDRAGAARAEPAVDVRRQHRHGDVGARRPTRRRPGTARMGVALAGHRAAPAPGRRRAGRAGTFVARAGAAQHPRPGRRSRDRRAGWPPIWARSPGWSSSPRSPGSSGRCRPSVRRVEVGDDTTAKPACGARRDDVG